LAGDVKEQDINNEMRAVVSLCMSHNPHKNIITVFQCGCLTPPWYYIDMELCEYNLEVWIRRRMDENGKNPSTSSTEQSRMAQIWGIMLDIIRGVMYIHQQNQIHRGLKPRNGISPLRSFALP
jgi:serine/threonine protein kinase